MQRRRAPAILRADHRPVEANRRQIIGDTRHHAHIGFTRRAERQFEFPQRKVTVNLAPADLPKESGRYDLPIALGILAATGQIPARELGRYEFAGELALTGELRAVRGALAMALSARRDGHAFVLPEVSAAEAAMVRGATVYGAASLLAVCAHLTARSPLPEAAPAALPADATAPDLADVRGQLRAKRALEIAAAGGHSLLIL